MNTHGSGRRAALAAFAITALALAGLVAPAQANPAVNPFAGAWAGAFAIVGTPQVGTGEWTISDAGHLTGTGYNSRGLAFIHLVGHVATDGTIQAVALFAPGREADPALGSASLDEDGHLNAYLTVLRPDGYSLRVTMVRVD